MYFVNTKLAQIQLKTTNLKLFTYYLTDRAEILSLNLL